MIEAPSFYAIIPANVRYDKNLKPNAKLLYGEITALCNKEGFCWADNAYFAGLYEVDKMTISRWITSLENGGYFTIEHFPEKGNLRKIFIGNMPQDVYTKKSIPIDEKIYTLPTKKSIGIDEKVYPNKDSITINNTMNKREGKALWFLIKNAPSELENFHMRFRKKFTDFEWEKFQELFDCKVDEEELEFTTRKLIARLTRFAINYTENLSKEEKKVTLTQKETDWQQNYSRPKGIIV